MKPLISMLVGHGPVLTDGAWGTQLQARGLAIGGCPEGWNLTHPDDVQAVARAYVDAGSRVILTNTFGANRFRLEEFGWSNKVAAINCIGVLLSRHAAGDRAVVFASLGPSGKLLAYGDTSPSELRDAFSEQAAGMKEGGADAIVVETMADLQEARLAVESARTTGLPVVACMVYDSGVRRDHTMMGVTPEEAAQGLADAGADVIGANCGNGIEAFVPVCRRLRAATQLPIWIKANAGLPEMENDRAVYKTTPEQFAGYVPALIDAGADFIGGCCGTSPEHIRAVRTMIDEHDASND